MQSNVSLNNLNYVNPYFSGNKAVKDGSGLDQQYSMDNVQSFQLPENGNDMLLNSLMAIANQNNTGGINGVKNYQNTSEVASMLKAGKKQEVKDEMGASAVPALLAIVKDTSQSQQVRVDAIATLAKLVDEGKAPASVLVGLLKDPNCKDMAERAMANVGQEIMPVVKQLLNSSDPALKESAKNILNDMVDAWSGYENDPKWGQEAQQLLPEVQQLLNNINGQNADGNKNNTSTGTNNNTANSTNGLQDNNIFEADDPENPVNLAGFTRQAVSLNKFGT